MSEKAGVAERPVAAADADTHPRYGALLIMIVATFVFMSASPSTVWSTLIVVLLQTGTVLAATHATKARPLLRHLANVIAAIGLIAAIAVLVASDGTSGQPDGRGTTFLLTAILVALAPLVVGLGVIDDLRARGVTVQAVMGAICIYLLLGLLFAFVYGAISNIGDAPFFTDGTDGDTQIRQYFSFVTLTTLGYGDFAPAIDLGRTVATIQALLGQLYLVTIVAVLVSNMGRRALGRDD